MLRREKKWTPVRVFTTTLLGDLVGRNETLVLFPFSLSCGNYTFGSFESIYSGIFVEKIIALLDIVVSSTLEESFETQNLPNIDPVIVPNRLA
ncbi:hypothetical protein KDJ56_10935 [Brevibacillus composti]|uniref:Uncharacterized protein n=1 Tax=Brevibacillus composti TaxID=2796470 RepID=A0A7T5EPI8_9BACL|nr:hypothetical protein [Brevibacillus composti]QQE76391.1 hypothetical protein JD108_11250 [Brevibacillus composti]QUO43418.1 hypothetical protein KDJ56_10935 [Brevibacillus composti]